MADLSTLNVSTPAGQDYIGLGVGGENDATRQRELRLSAVTSFDLEHHLAGPHAIPVATSVSGKLSNALTLDTTNGAVFIGNDSFPLGSERTLNWSEEYYRDSVSFHGSSAVAKLTAGVTYFLWDVASLEHYIELPAGTYSSRASFLYYSSTAGGSVIVEYRTAGTWVALHTLTGVAVNLNSNASGNTGAYLDSASASFTLTAAQIVRLRVRASGNNNLGITGGGILIRRTG